MGKSLTDKLNDLPDRRQERILAEADHLHAEYLTIQDQYRLWEAEEPPKKRLDVHASPA